MMWHMSSPEDGLRADFPVIVTYLCPEGELFEVRMKLSKLEEEDPKILCPTHQIRPERRVDTRRDTSDINPAEIPQN